MCKISNVLLSSYSKLISLAAGLTQNPCNQHRVLLKNKTRSSHTHVREQVVIHTFITQKPGMDEELETCRPTHSCLIQCCHLSPFHSKPFFIVFLCMLTSMKTWTKNYTVHDISEGGNKYRVSATEKLFWSKKSDFDLEKRQIKMSNSEKLAYLLGLEVLWKKVKRIWNRNFLSWLIAGLTPKCHQYEERLRHIIRVHI